MKKAGASICAPFLCINLFILRSGSFSRCCFAASGAKTPEAGLVDSIFESYGLPVKITIRLDFLKLSRYNMLRKNLNIYK